MDVLKIEGGRRLQGVIEVGGSKNATLAVLASIPLVDGITTLTNVPQISDVRIKLNLLEQFGCDITVDGDNVTIDSRGIHHYEPNDASVRAIRTSFYLLGPLLTRVGKAKLPMPGGCDIGDRPVNFHLRGLELMGVQVEKDEGCWVAENKGMKGAAIYLDFPSAGATQHLMATACLVEGVTTIHNAAVEPEVVQLGMFLQGAGAKINGLGTSMVEITGVDRLQSSTYRVPEDRIQVGTYLVAAAITKGDITCTNLLPEYQTAVVSKLTEMGANVEQTSDSIRVWTDSRLNGVKVQTMPYPGFPTDMQQPMCALMTLAYGTSKIEESIYETRFGHVAELARMGADIEFTVRMCTIQGVDRLQGASVKASDLRAGACLVLAGLAAEGTTRVSNVMYIDRGYENLESTLNYLGASVERLPGDVAVS